MSDARRYTLLEAQCAEDDEILTIVCARERHRNGTSGIRPRDWQVAAAKEFISGRDCFVVTATGSGKTLCYQTALIAKPASYLIAVFPLLSLMKDQVESAQRRGISACRITRQTIHDDPNLINDICRGLYQMICFSPEFIDAHNTNFMRINKSSVINKSLLGIVIDECHLCYTWRRFRPRYAHLGLLRSFYPKLPIMAMSATLSAHVMKFTQISLGLTVPCSTIKRSIDRPNIYLTASPITRGVAERGDLDFLVPLGLVPTEVLLIPKTIVFMDNRATVCDATTCLIARLPVVCQEADVICDYSTVLSERRREEVMRKFTDGACRILVCTEAAGMGVDVPDIVRMIQWTIPQHLNLAGFWQRAGRCARKTTIQGVAILFYNKAQKIKHDHPTLGILCAAADDPKTLEVLKMIRKFDSGVDYAKLRGVPGELTDDEGDQDPTPNRNSHCNPNHGSNEDQSDEEAPIASEDELDEENVEAEYNDKGPEGPTRITRTKLLKSTDRGIMWLLSTRGCRRKTALVYFGDSAESPFLNSPVGAACCDVCAKISGFNTDSFPEIHNLLPAPPLAAPPPHERRAPLPVTIIQREALKTSLTELREQIWMKEKLNHPTFAYSPNIFLEDSDITRIVGKCAAIVDKETLAKALTKKLFQYSYSAIEPHTEDVLECIRTALQARALEAPAHSQLTADALIESSEDEAFIHAFEDALSSNEPIPPPQPTGNLAGISNMNKQIDGILQGGLPSKLGRRSKAYTMERSRLTTALAAAADLNPDKWDFTEAIGLGKRKRGRVTAEESQMRKRLEIAAKELIGEVLTQEDFPMLSQEASRRIPDEDTPVEVDSTMDEGDRDGGQANMRAF